jgi:hypothetical protein
VIPASVRRIWRPLPFERRRAAREHATGGTSARLTLGGRYERQARLTAAGLRICSSFLGLYLGERNTKDWD